MNSNTIIKIKLNPKDNLGDVILIVQLHYINSFQAQAQSR